MKKHRILIAEDQLIVAEDVARLLEEAGYEVVGIIETGEEAVKVALTALPDLVLVDIQLKGPMDGVDAALAIRAGSDPAIVYLTAHSEKALFERARQTDPDGFLYKPVSPIELKRTVEIVLSKHTLEKRLRESEQRYRNLVEDSFDGILVQKGSEIVFANSRLHEMAGYEPGELIGKDHWIIYHPDYRTTVRERAQSRMRGETVIDNYEVKLQSTDGTVIDAEIRAKVVLFEGEAGVQVWVRDVSDRKRFQEEFRRVIENLKDPFYRADMDGVLTYLSPASEHLAGFKPEEGVGRPISVIYSDPSEREEFMKLMIEDGFVNDFEARLVHKDGHIVWVSTSARLYRDKDGNIAGVEGIAKDISERKRAQEALREREALIRSISDNLPSGMIYQVMSLPDGSRKFTYLSKSVTDFYGCSPEEAMNDPDLLYGRVFPEDRHRFFLEEQRAIENHSDFSIEARMINPSGDIRWSYFASSPKRLEDGSTFWSGLEIDITERKRAEEELRKSENRIRKLLEHSPTAMAVADIDGKVEYLNNKFVELFGYTMEDIPTLEHWWRLAYPDPHIADLVKSDWLNATMLAHRSGKEAEPIEREVRCRDGTIRVIDFRKTVVDKWVIHTLFDVTETKSHKEALRESEQMFRLLSEQSLMSVAILQDGVYRYANQAMSDLCEYTAEEILNWGPDEFLRVIHPDDRPLVMVQARMKQIGDPRQKTNYAFRIVAKSGRTKWVEIYSKTIMLRDRPANFITMVDITGRKQAEEQLLQSQKMEAIGTLAGGVAHEINNLLQVVLGHADLLRLREVLDDKSAQSLEAIRRAARNGASLANRILTFSRKTEPEARPLNLSEEVRRMEELLRRTMPRMISLETSLEDNLRMISADPSQIEQVLLNLSGNAGDAMPDGGRLVFETGNASIGEAYCRTHPDVKPGEYVVLTVSDTGQGMERETLFRVFEPFFTTKQPGQGTGLGLSMVYGVVKSHGGHITCDSRVGEGTTFKVYFPALGEEPQPAPEINIEMPAGGTETLLVVDDEDAIRTLAAEMMESAGYTVLTAARGLEALEVYRNNLGSIAMVILDLVMPEMSGRKCLEELLKLDPHAKVLIASGYAADGPAKEALDIGAKGFVSKPFDVREILAAIRQCLDEVSLGGSTP